MTVMKRTIACVGALLLAVTLGSCGQSAAPEEVANYLVEFQQPFVGREARDASELDAIVQNALEIAGDRESKIASDSEEGEQAKRMNNKFDMANDAYKKGDYAEAQRLYEAVLENVHGHYGANVNLTLALLQQNKNDEALAQALACCHTFPEEPEPLLNVQVAGAACGFHVDDVEAAADNVLQDAGSSLEALRAELTDEYDNFYIYNQVWDRIETDLHVQAEGDEGEDGEASAPEKPEYATYTALGVDLAVLGDELVDDSDVAALDAYYHAVGLQLGFEADPSLIEPVHTMPYVAVDSDLCTIRVVEITNDNPGDERGLVFEIENKTDDTTFALGRGKVWIVNGIESTPQMEQTWVQAGETKDVFLKPGYSGPDEVTSLAGTIVISSKEKNTVLEVYPISWAAAEEAAESE